MVLNQPENMTCPGRRIHLLIVVTDQPRAPRKVLRIPGQLRFELRRFRRGCLPALSQNRLVVIVGRPRRFRQFSSRRLETEKSRN